MAQDTTLDNRNQLQALGYDPDKYDMVEQGGGMQIVARQPTPQPSATVGNQQPGFGGNQIQTTAQPILQPGMGGSMMPTSSFGGAAFRSALQGAAPTLGGAAGWVGAAALAPDSGFLSLLVPLISSMTTAGTVAYGQKKLEQAILPADTQRQMALQQQADAEQHPIAGYVGDGLDMALGGFKPNISGIPGDIQTAGTLAARAAGMSSGSMPEAAALQSLINRGMNAGIQGGIAGINNYLEQQQSGQPFSTAQLLEEVGKQGSLGSVFSAVNKLGEAYGFHPGVSSKPDETQKERNAPVTGNRATAKAATANQTPPVTPEQSMAFDIGANDTSTRVPFTAQIPDPENEGDMKYVRPYSEVKAAAKLLAPGLLPEKFIPENPLDSPIESSLDEHTIRKMLDDNLIQQGDSGEGGLGAGSYNEQVADAVEKSKGVPPTRQLYAPRREMPATTEELQTPPEPPPAEDDLARIAELKKFRDQSTPPPALGQEEGQTPIGDKEERSAWDSWEQHALDYGIAIGKAYPGALDGYKKLGYSAYDSEMAAGKTFIERMLKGDPDGLGQKLLDVIHQKGLMPVEGSVDKLNSAKANYNTIREVNGQPRLQEGEQSKATPPTPEEDKVAYEKLQTKFAGLDPSAPTFDKDFQYTLGQMEAIKNRNKGYAPGTEPREQPTTTSKESVPAGAGRMPKEESSATPTTQDLTKTLPPLADWLTRLFKAAGIKRNIRVEPTTGRLLNDAGVPINGISYLRDGVKEAVAKMTYKQLDTWFHEPGGHIFFHDLLNSPHEQDRRVAQNMLETVGKDPAFKKWVGSELARKGVEGVTPDEAIADPTKMGLPSSKTGKGGTEAGAHEEFLAQHAGEYFAKNINTKVGGFKENFKDLVAAAKLRYGNATSEDASRLLHNRFFTDAPFAETHLKASAVGATPYGSQSREREQPTGVIPLDEGREAAKQEYANAAKEHNNAQLEEGKALEKYGEGTPEHLEAQSNMELAANREQDAKEKYVSHLQQLNVGKMGAQRNQESEQTPTAYTPREDKEAPVEGKIFGPTSAVIDKIRRSAPTEQGQHVADQLTKVYNYKDELDGQLANKAATINKSLSPADRKEVYDALLNTRYEQQDMTDSLRTTKQQQAYTQLRDILDKQSDIRLENGQPVITSNGNFREHIQDPNFMFTQLGRDQAKMLRENKPENQEKMEAMKQDFMDINKKHGASETIAEDRWDELVGKTRGDLDLAGPGTDSFFNGVRKQEGVPLPRSMVENDMGKAFDTHLHKASADMSWWKHVENDPQTAASLGYKKDGMGEPLSKETLKANPSLMGDKNVRDVVTNYRGDIRQAAYGSENAHAWEHIATTAMLGPTAQIHKVLASTAQMASIASSHPGEAAKLIYDGLTHWQDGYLRAVNAGATRVSPKTAADNLRLLVGNLSSVSDRIGALADLTYKGYTLGGLTDRFMTGNLQIMAEFKAGKEIASANAGNADSARFIKYFDPDYTPGKEYDSEAVSKLAAKIAGTVHGSGDPRTLPAIMTEDNELSAFLHLAHWSVSSTNAWMRNVWTPLTKGNFTPFLMHTLGATLGGYAIKKLKEVISDSKTPVPDFSEIMASNANREKGLYGRTYKENLDNIAYASMELNSLAGNGGIIASMVKGIMDVQHKNKFSGMGTIFPLDELATSTAESISHLVSAYHNGDTGFFEQAGKVLADWTKGNVQIARIALVNAEKVSGGQIMPEDYQRHLQTQKTQDFRRFQEVSGLPYEDQSNLGEQNPYTTLGAQQFHRNMDIKQAITEQLPPLVHNLIGRYGDKPQVLLDKLDALKKNSYQTIPDPETSTQEFASYYNYTKMTKGQQEATDRVIDYMKHKILNETKSAVIP